jgi:chorismate synthase
MAHAIASVPLRIMNVFGNHFRVSIFGESHGPWVGITIDGCPPGIPLSAATLLPLLRRRRAGAAGTTPRAEADEPIFASGLFNGFTTGAPLTILFANTNTRSADYEAQKNVPRPGHADFVLSQKFRGFNDYRGGGHSSGRLTLALVAAGAVAMQLLRGVTIAASVTEVGGNTDIEAAIAQAVQRQDSIGGIVACRVQNLSAGLGEPFFHSLESTISHMIFAIPAIKGIEFGEGFHAARMTGSTHNDAIIDASGATATNHAGGINGGISNGNEIYFRVAVKPTSSTPQPQNTLNVATGQVEEFAVKGRHDLCIALRVPPVVEAATAIALADHWLMSGYHLR